MRFLTVLGILFYSAVIMVAGAALIIFSFNILQPQDISNAFTYVQNNPNLRVAIGLSGALLILISYSFAQLILGRFQRERTIAFTTSGGQVTISLSAVEDLIRRLANIMPEIKDLRPDVIATKKGIIADLRVTLKSEANIPELTSRLQEITRAKIQEVLGIEEQIVTKIHVAKIIPTDEKDNRRKKEPEKDESRIPFGGYGRV